MRLVLLMVLLAAALPAPAAGATFAAPVDPPRIEDGCDYAGRGCLDRRLHHAGVDYLPSRADEPVRASADGIVRIAAAAGTDASHDFGHVVVLEHTLPEGGRVSTVYAHLRERPAVRPGDCVAGGTRLGFVGSTGAAANVHLHFEVKQHATLGPPYGYTREHPDEHGFFDPKLFVGRRAAADVCAGRPSDCASGTPRAAIGAVVRAASGLRVSGRVRRLPAGCRVQLSLMRRAGERCSYWRQSRRRMERRACGSPLWTHAGSLARAGDVARWSHRFRARFAGGRYELRVRLVDRAGRAHTPGGRAVAGFSVSRPR